MPESVQRWRQALAESQAVLIASPEYGFSMPGALKNGIDWVIGSGELEEKVVAITAAVAGPERGRRGLHALRDTLVAVRATIVGRTNPKGPGLPRSQVAALVRALIEGANRIRLRRCQTAFQAQSTLRMFEKSSVHNGVDCGIAGVLQRASLASDPRSVAFLAITIHSDDNGPAVIV